MQQTGPTAPPDSGGGLRARFGRRQPEEPRLLPSEYRLADALQRAVEERLEDGLQAIEEQATTLMREIASEIWRVAGSDVRPEQERIVSLLSRDQALKGLIATSDERFQALAVRASRLEDSLRELAETGRSTREAMESSAQSIREIAGSPTLHGVEMVRTQLEQVERHIAVTLQHLDDRDRALTEHVLTQVHEHGELVARETTRVVEAMQGYVQSGAEAMGRLAQRVEAHAEAFASGEAGLDVGPLRQAIDMLDERLGIHGREMHDVQRAVERVVDARMMALAQLIRSDSEALRGLIEQKTEQQEATLRQTLDERMADVKAVIDTRVIALANETAEQVSSLATAITASVDRNLERIGEQLGQVDGLDTMLAETQAASEDRLSAHIDDRITAIARLIRSDNKVLAERVTGGGGLDPDLLRQTVRSVKELEAGLGSDLLGSMDRRFQLLADQLHKESQSTAEAMIKVAEVLGQKIDRVAVTVDEGVGSDLQIVIDRMSDAIQAMSGRGQR
jgi:hypothetical protein